MNSQLHLLLTLKERLCLYLHQAFYNFVPRCHKRNALYKRLEALKCGCMCNSHLPTNDIHRQEYFISTIYVISKHIMSIHTCIYIVTCYIQYSLQQTILCHRYFCFFIWDFTPILDLIGHILAVSSLKRLSWISIL